MMPYQKRTPTGQNLFQEGEEKGEWGGREVGNGGGSRDRESRGDESRMGLS